MDPSIMKFLEEDVDETMHSGADVDAFTAALNRDIEGDTSSSQPAGFDSEVTDGNQKISSQLHSQCHTSRHDGMSNSQVQQDVINNQLQEQPPPEMQPNQHDAENLQPQRIDSSELLDCLPSRNETQDILKDHHTEKIGTQLPQLNGVQQPKHQTEEMCSQPTKLHLSGNDNVSSTVEMNQKVQVDFLQQQEPIPLQHHQLKGVQISERNPVSNCESQYSKLPASKELPMPQKIASNPVNNKQIPFARLLPVLRCHLDEEKYGQLHMLFSQLRNNEVAKDVFVRQMKGIVGDQKLKIAVAQVQKEFSMSQPHQKGHHSPGQLQTDSCYSNMEKSAQRSQEMERLSDSQVAPVSDLNTFKQEKDLPNSSIQGFSKQQQQHFHFPQPSFPTYGGAGSNYHPCRMTSVNAPVASPRPQTVDTQMRHVPHHQSVGQPQFGGSNAESPTTLEMQNSINDPRRTQVASHSNLIKKSTLQPNSFPRQPLTSTEQNNSNLSSMVYVKEEPFEQNHEQKQHSRLCAPPGSSFPVKQIDQEFDPQSFQKQSPITTAQIDHNIVINPGIISTPSPAGTNVKTPPKKASITQKKPLEAHCSSPPLSNKKQKVVGTFSDLQSIEQLNDVTAVSGVNLREEEEQMFSGQKEDNRVSELSRKSAREEDERLILQKTPLQKKLAMIIGKCGILNVSTDVERCLSLCVEERMRGLIGNLIRVSKQRSNFEKSRHRTFITSDVRQQIFSINQKAKEECEKKHAEEEKLRKLHDPDDPFAVDGDKEKDEGRIKSLKVHKEEDDKMRATAANVAARAAAGGADVLSKWQLMAEQAREKRDGGSYDEGPINSSGSEINCRSLPTASRNNGSRDNQAEQGRGNNSPSFGTSGNARRFGRNVGMAGGCSISIKDVIAILEREPQMCKSTLIYRLYDKLHAAADPATVE